MTPDATFPVSKLETSCKERVNFSLRFGCVSSTKLDRSVGCFVDIVYEFSSITQLFLKHSACRQRIDHDLGRVSAPSLPTALWRHHTPNLAYCRLTASRRSFGVPSAGGRGLRLPAARTQPFLRRAALRDTEVQRQLPQDVEGGACEPAEAHESRTSRHPSCGEADAGQTQRSS